MNNQQKTCNPEWIELFLKQKLSDEEQRGFELHLDDCKHCRQRLESAAASDDVWTGVRDSLCDEQLSLDDPELDDSTFDSAIDGDAQFSYSSILKLLAPTDDERMLGRLGTYEVVGVIGSGGMGIVLKAFDSALNRYVAIKILTPHLGSSGAARKRFSREAQAAAAVVHDNVIEIYGVADVGGLPYLVMPYVPGPSLQRRLDEAGPLALVEILRIGMQAATGLAAAHAQGLVHRDVKPANILLADGVERVKLTDFGLARAADDASLTKTGFIAGTPEYMSPEQARGESVDQRSDLFSLGSVLYAMCTCRAPFRAETSYGMLRRITDEEPRPIREINSDIPEWVCQIISRLMSKQSDDRFASAREVTALLEECLAHVQQPTQVPLPDLLEIQSKGNGFFSNSNRSLGVFAMIAAFTIGLLGMFFLQAAEAPDISGKWTSDGWGTVVLKNKQPGQYEGTFKDTEYAKSGTLHLKWSRIERRYKGTWDEGKERFGKISVRLANKELHGAWTTSKKSRVNPGTPELADLLWIRAPKANVNANNKPLFRGRVVSVSNGKAVISIGQNQRVKMGTKLAALDKGLFRGQIDIIKVEAERSVGRIVEQNVKKPIQVGFDVERLRTVSPMIANSNLAKPRSASQPGRGKVNKKIGLDTFVEEQESKRILPTTDAEKAIARLVFVFYADRSRRAIPAILVDAGSQTLIITAGPATLVPDGTPAARDRTFVEIPGRPSLDARYQNESTKDLFVFRTNNRLSEYRPAVRVKLEVGDNLSAILPGGSTELFITPKAARIVALNREADLKLPKHKIEHHYEKLVVINRSLPEGTPLFKDGKLAGLTLLGSRFLGEKANKSYVIPVERIVAFFQEIKPVSGTDISTIQPAKSQPKTTQAIPAKGKTATPFESPLNTIGKD